MVPQAPLDGKRFLVLRHYILFSQQTSFLAFFWRRVFPCLYTSKIISEFLILSLAEFRSDFWSPVTTMKSLESFENPDIWISNVNLETSNIILRYWAARVNFTCTVHPTSTWTSTLLEPSSGSELHRYGWWGRATHACLFSSFEWYPTNTILRCRPSWLHATAWALRNSIVS